ncbi:MAG: DNA-3-methyladenine glycosylase I [Dehalococcoidales bacterium]|nr:DNA-3-methyladenine glycosylase I [Dehalococcoidales bacterium]
MHEPLKQPLSLSQYLGAMSQAGFQAGISWKVVEAKWPGIEKAFKGFDPTTVARFSGEDIDRLMQNPEVIRNRAKLEGIVLNARRLLELEKTHGTFKNYLKSLGSFENQLKVLHKEFKFLGESGAYYFLWRVGEKVPDWEEWENRHASGARNT